MSKYGNASYAYDKAIISNAKFNSKSSLILDNLDDVPSVALVSKTINAFDELDKLKLKPFDLTVKCGVRVLRHERYTGH